MSRKLIERAGEPLGLSDQRTGCRPHADAQAIGQEGEPLSGELQIAIGVERDQLAAGQPDRHHPVLQRKDAGDLAGRACAVHYTGQAQAQGFADRELPIRNPRRPDQFQAQPRRRKRPF
jgi:hypothetical protein